MAEKEEKKEPEPKAKGKAEAKPAEAKAAAPAEAKGEKEPRKPKLSRLSLQEIEETIKKTQEKMGGLHSQYGRFLLRRKQVLSEK